VFADAAEVIAAIAPDHPIHCFSPSTLVRFAETFLSGFPGEVSYAVKANDAAHVLETLGRNGIGTFDVASTEEMEATSAVVPGARFHYHNPVKSRGEIARAYGEFGVRRFAVDDMGELTKIADCLGNDPQVEIAVRFRLIGRIASAHDFSGKFGATPDKAAHILRQATALGFVPALTFHPGSQCSEPDAYERHIEAAAAIAFEAGVRLAALNVGGGFPAKYLDLPTPPLDVYFRAIAEAAARGFGADFVPRLECEPGRGIVAASTSVLARVKLVKNERGEVFLNDGIYGSLMEVAQVPSLQPIYSTIRDGRYVVGETAFTAYGPTCDPLDRLPNKMMLPDDLAEGEYIEFGGVGAYGTATSTRFNGYGEAEVVDVVNVLGA
jgi:ornithine decarboxylase